MSTVKHDVEISRSKSRPWNLKYENSKYENGRGLGCMCSCCVLWVHSRHALDAVLGNRRTQNSVEGPTFKFARARTRDRDKDGLVMGIWLQFH